MKHYLIYKITNKVNNKIYVGCHVTDNIDDEYMGSGTVLKRAQEKYGMDKFQREILFECNGYEEMIEKEREIVDEVFIARLDTYNVTVGGYGTWWHVHKNNLHKIGGARAGQIFREHMEDEDYKEWFSTKVSNALCLFYSQNEHHWIGRKHKESTKSKIGKANSIHQKGVGNSQYGTMWITNGVKNRKIKKGTTIPKDWYKGRTGNK